MARVVINYLDGHSETETNCGTSVWKGFLYIWNPGVRKGQKPRRKIPVNLLHKKKKSGKRAFDIFKY